jgi:hypothetical protein
LIPLKDSWAGAVKLACNRSSPLKTVIGPTNDLVARFLHLLLPASDGKPMHSSANSLFESSISKIGQRFPPSSALSIRSTVRIELGKPHLFNKKRGLSVSDLYWELGYVDARRSALCQLGHPTGRPSFAGGCYPQSP